MIFQHAAVGEEMPPSRKLIHAAKEFSQRYQKPVAFCYLTEEEELAYIKRAFDYPIFTEPEDALSALAISREHYYRKQRISKESPPSYSVDRGRVRHLIQKAKREKRDPILPEAFEIFQAYGIPVADYQVVHQKSDLKEVMDETEAPVALKIISSEVSHKSDAGGVILNVDGLKKAEEAYDRIKKLDRGSRHGVLIQEMIPGGKEIILGAKRDPSFGPVLLFGLGGIYVEVFKETSLRVAPINRSEAEEMISELKTASILKGLRGERPLDVGALIENLLKLSQLMMDFPEIEGIDINPVKVLEKGAIAVDARIVLSDAHET
jgi:acetyltransferase